MRTIDIDKGPIRYPGAMDWDRSEHGISPRRLPGHDHRYLRSPTP